MNGQPEREIQAVSHSQSVKYDWFSLVMWVLSICIALLPIYVAYLTQLSITDKPPIRFWFECLGKNDGLWALGTVLLFCCCNTLIKIKNQQRVWKHAVPFIIAGIIDIVLIDVTWYIYKYVDFSNASSDVMEHLLRWGAILITAVLIISTPLQFDFVRKEG